ncbi:peptidoglycan DD-metalloendopeptidase family protein [Sedimentibacter sp.]|uniref:M23 family metallopeptidase n=1 Tax=Sedimentibacter sp. TaxID=1960295 RepID=UPI0028B06105|nr:peptidoglycan DD-metalloendopeptidase family protein [Sedimentibacter sp.]
MFTFNKEKKVKKKYENSKLHFIMFLTSEKPINLSISKWVVYTGLSVLVLTIAGISIFSYNTYSLKMRLDDSLANLEKEIQRLQIDKIQVDIENKSLKSSLDYKTQMVESAIDEIECLQDSINEIKDIVGLPADEEKVDESLEKKTEKSAKDLSNIGQLAYLPIKMTTMSRSMSGLRSFENQVKETSELRDDDDFEKIDKLIAGTKGDLEELLSSAEDRKQYLKDVPIKFPTQGRITSTYGQRWGKFHRGLDIANVTGTEIYAAGNGRVIESKYNNSYGNYVLIEHKNGFRTRYAHMSKRLVEQGAEINQGDLIGLIGNTGTSYGSHLHYEIYLYGKLINPLEIADYLKYNE